MGYRDESQGYRAPSLAVGSFLLIFALWHFGKPVIGQWLATAALATEIGAKDVLLRDPVVGPVMTTLRDRFPDDFQKLIASVNAGSGKFDLAATGRTVVQQIDAVIARDNPLLTRAPAPTLAAIRQSELAIMQRLQRTNPTICAEIGETGTTARPLSPHTSQMLFAHRDVVLRAIAAGRDTPVAARIATPKAVTAAQGQLHAPLLSAITSVQARELLNGERTADQALPIHRCELQVALRVALNNLPPDTADLLMIAP